MQTTIRSNRTTIKPSRPQVPARRSRRSDRSIGQSKRIPALHRRAQSAGDTFRTVGFLPVGTELPISKGLAADLKFISKGHNPTLATFIRTLYNGIIEFEGVRASEPQWSEDTSSDEVVGWMETQMQLIENRCRQVHGKDFGMAIVLYPDNDLILEFSLVPKMEHDWAHMSLCWLPTVRHHFPRLHKLAMEVLNAFSIHTCFPTWETKWEKIRDWIDEQLYDEDNFEDDEHQQRVQGMWDRYETGVADQYERKLNQSFPSWNGKKAIPAEHLASLRKKVKAYGKYKKGNTKAEYHILQWLEQAMDVMEYPDAKAYHLFNLPFEYLHHADGRRSEATPIEQDQYLTFQWDYDELREDLDMHYEYQMQEAYIADTLYADRLEGHTTVPQLPEWVKKLDQFCQTGQTIKNDLNELFRNINLTKRRNNAWHTAALTSHKQS